MKLRKDGSRVVRLNDSKVEFTVRMSLSACMGISSYLNLIGVYGPRSSQLHVPTVTYVRGYAPLCVQYDDSADYKRLRPPGKEACTICTFENGWDNNTFDGPNCHLKDESEDQRTTVFDGLLALGVSIIHEDCLPNWTGLVPLP